MILILHSVVYFLFCMMGISCLSSLGSKSTLKSQGPGLDRKRPVSIVGRNFWRI